MPPTIDRRRFLGLTAGALFLACNKPTVENLINKERKEDEVVDGNVLLYKNTHYLFNNSLYYPIADFNDWALRSKYHRYGKPVTEALGIDQNAMGDPYDDYVKNLPFRTVNSRKPLGGEINLYFPGFLTDGSQVYDTIDPHQDTFSAIGGRLFAQGFNPLFDSGYFGYGREQFGYYTPKDSAKSPVESMEQAIVFLREMKKAFPLCRFNLMGHSLGGLMALAAAKKYPGVINNVILLSAPVRGIEKTPTRLAVLSGVGLIISSIIGMHEQVSSTLFSMAQDDAYQKSLDQFSENFVHNNHGLYVFGSSNDPIIPVEAMGLKGAKNTIWEMETGYAGSWDPIGLKGHGASLIDPRVIKEISQIIGDNMSSELLNPGKNGNVRPINRIPLQ